MTDAGKKDQAGIKNAPENCPCCNSAAVHAAEEGVWHLVRCTNRKCGMQSGIFPTKPMAFRCWNTRALAPEAKGADFAFNYTEARQGITNLHAQGVVSRNAVDEKLYRPDDETDMEFVRRIVATYLALSYAPPSNSGSAGE